MTLAGMFCTGAGFMDVPEELTGLMGGASSSIL